MKLRMIVDRDAFRFVPFVWGNATYAIQQD